MDKKQGKDGEFIYKKRSDDYWEVKIILGKDFEVGKLNEIQVFFDEDFKENKVMNNLYSFQRLRQEIKRAKESGFLEGEDKGYKEGMEEGIKIGYELGYKARKKDEKEMKEWERETEKDWIEQKKRIVKSRTVKGKEGRKKAVPLVEQGRIKRLKAEGKSLREIEKVTGVSRTTVGKIVNGKY